MSNVTINRVVNANIYIDGLNLLGRAEELNAPTIKNKLGEHKALGMIGNLEYASGIDKMEMKIKWNSFYVDVIKKSANPYQAVSLQVRSSIENYEAGSRVRELPLTIYLRGQFKELPLGNFKAQDNVELESNLTITYCKIEVDGVALVEVDVESNIYIVDGVDLMAKYRSNLGI